jgi:para-nitrobenzyl esterase
MGGSNLQDSNLNRTDFSIDENAAEEQLKSALSSDTARLWNAYRAADPRATPANLLARISSDRGIRANTRTVAERKAALGQAPGFLYLLRWPAPFMDGRYGSVHGTDVPLTAGAPDGHAISDRMAGCFMAFAKTGNPSTPELPWPAYNPGARPTMVFDTQSSAENNPDRDLLALLPPHNGP